jgi:site-specific DNA recombinase
MKTVRCAIYTRKSSDEGLEQGFNSLDAQREACAAYILSQASEGWSALPDIYDDGGISGGTLERPALQRLLADVAAGRIDIIVVYKVDRLTRSLLDFAKLVEAFDKANTSFVSITQSFNTTTSMGRLTLNMLLSFAQFEREVTAERIRDKIAASKAKRMWMGGTPPLGYRPDGRTLAIVEEQAALVHDIYRRYLDLGNVRLVTEQLVRDGVLTPARTTGTGKTFGACQFTRGQLYAILKNPIYIGDIAHKDKRYPGQHPAIVERDDWDRVQVLLANNLQGRRSMNNRNASLLAGKLVDAEGEPLLAVHAAVGKARYRYYVSRRLQHEPGSTGMRIPAREIETAVCKRVTALLDDPLLTASTAYLSVASSAYRTFTECCSILCLAVAKRDAASVRALVAIVRIHESRIEITLDVNALATAFCVDREPGAPDAITLLSDVLLTRSGRAMRLVQNNGVAVAAPPDHAILNLLVKAQQWWAVLRLGDLNVVELARREGVTKSYVSRVVRLAFLSPRIVEVLVAGKISIAVNRRSLVATDAITPRWADQEMMLRAKTVQHGAG